VGIRCILCVVVMMGCAFAQTLPRFEIASVKAIKPGSQGEPSITTTPDTLTVRSTNLTGLLMWAYQIRNANEIQGPDWRYTQDFDVTAKSAAPVSTERLRLMLQALLEDRFKMAIRREQRIVLLLDRRDLECRLPSRECGRKNSEKNRPPHPQVSAGCSTLSIARVTRRNSSTSIPSCFFPASVNL